LRLRNILALLAILLVLGVVYLVVGRPSTGPTTQPKVYVWSVSDNDITHITISLPREGQSQAFIKIPEGDKFPWYFDDPQRSPVDTARWGGGIPLILSGPSADRIIAEYATAEQLAEYGLTQPSMEITLALTNDNTMKIDVGDSTPNGNNYYVKAPDSTGVATVDSTWYDVLEKLVTNPPYAATANTSTEK
jgi:hypothetical protein